MSLEPTFAAVILAPGWFREDGAFQDLLPAPMLPLADRPFLQHVVEALADHGVRDLHFVLGSHPDCVEQYFQDGHRWGVACHYHLAACAGDECAVLRRLPLHPATHIVVAAGESLPHLPSLQPDGASSLTVWVQPDSPPEWAGWAVLETTAFHRFAADAIELADLGVALVRESGLSGKQISAQTALRVRTAAELLASQERLLNGAFPEIELTGRPAAATPDVRVGHHARIDTSAELIPPVFIGADSIVGPRTRVGPNVVLGRECILEPETSVRNALICDQSFVGEHLILDGVLVDQSRLRHVRLGTEFTVPDDLVLDSVRTHWVRGLLRGAASRLLALLLFAVTLPLALAVRITHPVLYRRKVLRLPVDERGVFRDSIELRSRTPDPPDQLDPVRHFFLVFLPGLSHVMSGKLRLVGVAPRSSHDVASLPPTWRDAYLHAHAGLITEAFVYFRHPAAISELEASEVWFAKKGGLTEDLRLLGRYLTQVITAMLRATAKHTEFLWRSLSS